MSVLSILKGMGYTEIAKRIREPLIELEDSILKDKAIKLREGFLWFHSFLANYFHFLIAVTCFIISKYYLRNNVCVYLSFEFIILAFFEGSWRALGGEVTRHMETLMNIPMLFAVALVFWFSCKEARITEFVNIFKSRTFDWTKIFNIQNMLSMFGLFNSIQGLWESLKSTYYGYIDAIRLTFFKEKRIKKKIKMFDTEKRGEESYKEAAHRISLALTLFFTISRLLKVDSNNPETYTLVLNILLQWALPFFRDSVHPQNFLLPTLFTLFYSLGTNLANLLLTITIMFSRPIIPQEVERFVPQRQQMLGE